VNEIRICGFGGQGVIRCGYIIGKTAALFDGKHATLTQSFGPEARGSACSAQIVVDDNPIRYPYVTVPDTVVAMSQEAYDKYGSCITEDGTLIIDEDLVKPGGKVPGGRFLKIPSTRFAEELGERIVGNIVMLGFFTAVAGIISVEAARKALPSSVPKRLVDLNVKAFERGWAYGMEVLGEAAASREARGGTGEAAASRKARGGTGEAAASKKARGGRGEAGKKKQ
jgi:2-oxoglutarate ferredoxin oxidoreductase subunit gamma